MEVTYGRRRPDEHRRHWRLASQAFLVRPRDYDPDAPDIGDERVHVARIDGQLAATVMVWPFGQWFGGRRVPTGGVAAVAVAPELRGRGVARRLLTEALQAMRERGEVLSGLYPTTARLYRSMGWEHAVRYLQVGVSIETLSRLPTAEDGYTVRRLEMDELSVVRDVYGAMARHHDGWLDRGDVWWARVAHRFADGNRFAYVVERDGAAAGAVLVEHSEPEGRRPGFHLYDLTVDGPFATEPGALRAAMAVLAGHGTTVGEVRTVLPVELLSVLVPDQHFRVAEHMVNMLRIVDLPGAMAARGYRAERAGPVQLQVRDPVAPWNDGRWSLAAEDGAGWAEPGGDGHLDLDVTTLAALWSGWASPWHLAQAGRLRGAAEADLIELSRLFASRSTPHLLDFY